MNQSMLSFRPTAGFPLMSRQQPTDISVSRSVISYSSRHNDTNTLTNQQTSALVRPEAVSLDALYFYRLYLNQLTLQHGNVFASNTTHSLFSSHQSAFAPPTVGRDELKSNFSNSSETQHQNSAIVSALSLSPVKNEHKRQPTVTAEQRWLDHYNKRSHATTKPHENDQNNNETSTFCKSSTPTILLTDQNTETKNDNGNLVDSLSCQICRLQIHELIEVPDYIMGFLGVLSNRFLSCNVNFEYFSLLNRKAHYFTYSYCNLNANRHQRPSFGFSCEGCKSFFKRTVQSKRVYTCVNGNVGGCIVTKQQRNRCQYCRFAACLRQGMIVEAVREDRMPGGRNGSAIYNLYKLKYRKRRRNQSTTSASREVDEPKAKSSNVKMSDWTEPLRLYRSKNLIEELIEIDSLESLISLRGLRIRTAEQDAEEDSNAAQRLSRIGDEIVEQLVEWTKILPFYNELPVEAHTHLLTQRWAELVLLSSCYYAYTTSALSPLQSGSNVENANAETNVSFTDPNVNLRILQRRLSMVMGREIPLEHVRKEAGPLVEKFTSLLQAFCTLTMTLEAYVCLKAITLLHYTSAPDTTNKNQRGNIQGTVEEIQNANIQGVYVRKVSLIQDQFVKALQIHLSQCENGRLSDILTWLPMLHSASSVLLDSKMFYVPFLICREPEQLRSESPLVPAIVGSIARPSSASSLKTLEAEETDCSSSDASAPRNHPIYS